MLIISKLKIINFKKKILIILIIVGVIVRLNLISSMSTHVDELLVATAIIEKKQDQINFLNLELDKKCIFFNFKLKLKNFINPILEVVRHSTYAPGQFILTAFFLNYATNYTEIIILGRLPSLLASFFSIIIIAILAKKLVDENKIEYSILATTSLCFSWEFIIFSNQMNSYAIGVLLILIILYFIIKSRDDFKWLFFESITISILSWFQYQVVFFLPAYCITRSIMLLNNNNLNKLTIIKLLITNVLPIISTILLYILLLRHYPNSGVGWNSGLHHEYLFNTSYLIDNINFYKYFIKFFSTNFLHVLTAITIFLPEDSILYSFFQTFIIILFFLGLYSMSRKQKVGNIKKYVFLFFVISSFVFILLILAKKITLSPTRHYLIFLPFFSFFVTEGLFFLTNISNHFINTLFRSVFWFLILFGFFFNYSIESNKRIDPFEEKKITTLVKNIKCDLIISYDNTLNLRLMKNLHVPLFDCGGGVKSKLIGNLTKKKITKILLISGRSPITKNTFLTVINSFTYQNLDNDLKKYKMSEIYKINGMSQQESSSFTSNGTNSLYITILDLYQ